MIHIRKGCVVAALLDGEVDCILHVTNCQGKMRSGVANAVRTKIPLAYEEYMACYKQVGLRLGSFTESKGVFNMNAQKYYGYDGKRYLDYGALAECLLNVREVVKDSTSIKTIGIPYKMGSDRAGGDWEIVLEMVKHILQDFEIHVYRLTN